MARSRYCCRCSETPLAGLALGIAVLLGAGCAIDPAPVAAEWEAPDGGNGDCTSEGCACSNEGQSVACGKLVDQSETTITCSMGHATCQDGVLGPCSSDRVVTRSKNGSAVARSKNGSRSLLGLQATPSDCVTDPCNPYCQNFTDTPDGVDAGGNFIVIDGGLTLQLAPIPVACTGLVLTPSSTNPITVTGISPFTTDSTITYTASLTPSNCYTKGYNVLWDIDHGERASVTSTGATTAVVSVLSAVTGPVTIYAYTGGLGATATANVKVRIRDSSVDTNQKNNFWNTDETPKTTSGTSHVAWLYPYDNTLLPLGLAAPVVQWQNSSGAGTTTSVKLTLRYPATGTTTFEYSKIYKPDPNPLQVTIPQLAWQGFEQTAQNSTGVISLQRYTGTLEPESTRTVKLASGKLKGTVYYNSYNSQYNVDSGGTAQGAVLAIHPGAATPTLAIPGKKGKCHVCHSLSADGSRLFFQNDDYDSSAAYDVKTGNLLYSYSNTSSPEYGDRFDWGAIYPDGSFVFNHSKDGYHAFGNVSKLYPVAISGSGGNTSTTATALSGITGIPNDLQGVTPAFSPDGRKVVFNFWAGTTTNGIASASGKSLVAADFSCGAATGSVSCSASPPTSTSISNWRQLLKVGP
jgi:hypothetical protein